MGLEEDLDKRSDESDGVEPLTLHLIEMNVIRHSIKIEFKRRTVPINDNLVQHIDIRQQDNRIAHLTENQCQWFMQRTGY